MLAAAKTGPSTAYDVPTMTPDAYCQEKAAGSHELGCCNNRSADGSRRPHHDA